MAYIGFEQEEADASIKTVSDLTIPTEATHAELQAFDEHVMYTMDGITSPTTTLGMALLTTVGPKLFLIEDIRAIRFTQVRGGSKLNVHYVGRET